MANTDPEIVRMLGELYSVLLDGLGDEQEAREVFAASVSEFLSEMGIPGDGDELTEDEAADTEIPPADPTEEIDAYSDDETLGSEASDDDPDGSWWDDGSNDDDPDGWLSCTF